MEWKIARGRYIKNLEGVGAAIPTQYYMLLHIAIRMDVSPLLNARFSDFET
jgi:hypothetical protein